MKGFEPIIELDSDRPECTAGIAALQRLLDGEPNWDTAGAASHRTICQECREELSLASSLTRMTSDVVIPSGLSERILNSALHSGRRRRFIRFSLAASTLAACFVVAIVSLRKPDHPGVVEATVAVAPTPESPSVAKSEPKRPLGESMSEARDAIVGLTKRTASETTDQSSRLMTTPKMPVATNPGEGLEPLADVRTGAARSVEPMQHSAKRAFNLFLRAADPPDRRQ